MEMCIAMTIAGDPCPNQATMGDYCVLHAPGWESFKISMVRLWAVYGYATALLGVVDSLIKIFGATGSLQLNVRGQTREVHLGRIRDTLESIPSLLKDFASDESSHEEVENIVNTVVYCQVNVRLAAEHLIAEGKKLRSSEEKER